MSKSTKWMKKGFAWLLCLIMMTGMLSSAASASSSSSSGLTIDESSFVDANWVDGSTPLPSFTFSIEYVKPSNRSSNNWTVEYHWYRTDANGKNPTKVNVQGCTDTDGVPVKTLSFDKNGVATDTETRSVISAEGARKGYRYYCEVVIKHTSSQWPYTTSEYARMTTQKKVKVVVINEYELLFDYPDGQVDKTVKVKIGAKAPVQADPTTTDTTKVFDKWVYQDTNEAFDFSKAVPKSGTLVPTWKDAPIPQVTYKYNGHGYVDETIPVGEDGMPKNLTPVCGDGTNHRFIKWCKDEALTIEYEFGKEPKPTTNITLYALWGNVITFDLTNPITNEKIEIETQVVPKGKTVTEPTVPSIEGYSFNGWTKDGNTYSFNKGVGDKGFRLVGSWTKLKTLTLTTNDTVSLTYDGGSKEGYVSISGLDKDDKNCAQIVITDSNGQEVAQPINAGTYTAQIVLTQQGVNSKKYVVDSNAGSLEFKIEKKKVSVKWEDLEVTYNYKRQKPSASLVGLSEAEKRAISVSVSVEGGNVYGVKNAGKYSVTAEINAIPNNYYYGNTINLENFVFENKTEVFVIKGMASSITADNIEKNFGDPDFKVDYKTTGCNSVTIKSLDTDVATVTADGKIHIVKAGTASIKLTNKKDNYETSEVTITLVVKAKDSSVDAQDIEKTYGDVDFTVDYSTTGCNSVTFDSLNPSVATVTADGKIHIVKAGTASIKLTNKADNYETSTKTITLTVKPMPVVIEWKNTEFDYDGEEHCPTAKVVDDYCGVSVQGAAKEAGPHTATAVLDDENYVISQNETQDFFIKKHVEGFRLVLADYKNDYVITNAGIPALDLTGIQYVISYDDGSEDDAKDVTEEMVSAISATNLGTQAITVTYTVDNKTLIDSFDIIVKKELTINWNAEGLVYNGKTQGPEASVDGFESLDGIIDITFAGVNANTVYTATATLTEAGKSIYTLAAGCASKDYTIAPAKVSVSWNYGNDAKPNGNNQHYYYFYDGNTHKPEAVLTGATIEDCGLTVEIIKFVGGSDSEAITNPKDAGTYVASCSLRNKNYTLSDFVPAFYSIYNRIDAFSLNIRVPQCGETVFVNSDSITGMLRAGFSSSVLVMEAEPVQIAPAQIANTQSINIDTAVNAQVATRDRVDVVQIADEKSWATVTDNDNLFWATGVLLPEIAQVTNDQDLKAKISAAIDGKETIVIDGDLSYSILFAAIAGNQSAIDTNAIANKIIASAQHNGKAVEVKINYVLASQNVILVLVNVHAVHNYDDKKEEINPPTEGVAGTLTKKCYLGDAFNHNTDVEIPALEVTAIEVVKGEGFKDNYFVGDAFDYTGLKIKVYLSNGEEAFDKSYEKDVTEDDETITVSGFDSKEAGKKTITVAYGGKEAKFDITVSKKKSSIDLKNVGNEVTVTYGSAPIEITFDAENGNVVITSSDESVAKIEKNQVVAVGAGQAKITLKIEGTVAVEGSEKSFTLIVEQKVVGLSWSAENTFEEDGKTHCPTVKATELVGNDTCDVIVDGATAEVGTHTAKATGLSNPNYKLPAEITITFTITAKEQPKEDPKDEPKKDDPKDEPKKDDPKEEPKKDGPKFTTVITIGSNFKTVYDKGDKFNPDGLTIEVVDENGKKTTVAVTEDMVKGFDSSKEGDIVITIQYEDASKEVPIKILSYNIKVFFDENGNLKIECHRSEDDSITFSLFLGARVDGKEIPKDAQKSWSGSLHMLVYADYIKSLAPGEHTLEILFKDGVAKTTFTVAATPASDASPVTGDTSSLTMWIILLAAAAAVLVAIRVYAAKRSNAE